LALLRKSNREAKAWRRWWWWCWSTRLHSVRRSRVPTSICNDTSTIVKGIRANWSSIVFELLGRKLHYQFEHK
jgi:hypothetical protein